MIVAKNPSKNFGAIKAVTNVSFCIGKGEIVTLLGPNGAGKTTLMRMLTGYLQPTSGSAEIFGCDVATQRIEALQNIGYVPENSPLYGDMTVYEYLRFMARLRKINESDFAARYRELASQFELKEVVNQRIENLSKGFKHRTAISGALVASPQVLILDEPTEGLDPNQKLELRRFLRDYGKNNIVVVSTHIMEEVEAIATRVIMLNHGRLIKDTTAAELKKFSPRQNMEEAFRNITNKE